MLPADQHPKNFCMPCHQDTFVQKAYAKVVVSYFHVKKNPKKKIVPQNILVNSKFHTLIKYKDINNAIKYIKSQIVYDPSTYFEKKVRSLLYKILKAFSTMISLLKE
ncbi:hypothetical protein HZS_3833 [Henneguya salminicola]|nr:hypothetical protein HZS_3833 [Henneguya salminicola]